MKNILVPIDFSSCSENALQTAIELAKKASSVITLLNVCHVPLYASEIPLEEFVEERIYENATAKLDLFINEHFGNSKIKIESKVSMGLAGDNIISMAAEIKADLIVMGTKGASGIEEIVLGSVASSVTEKTHCPVLIVPPQSHSLFFDKIVYATDYKENNFKYLNNLSEFASLFNSEIMVVHIAEILKADEYERDLFKLFEKDFRKEMRYSNLSFHFLSGLHIAETLNNFIESSNAGMLAVSTRRRNMVSRIFDPSLTKKMACHTKIPLLVLPVN